MAAPTTPPAWRRAFLRELALSGSVALAAGKCGIDRTSPYQARRNNSAFAASWDRALETAREALSPRGIEDGAQRLRGDLRPHANRQPPEAPACAGARLLPDQIVRSSKTGHPCIARAGPGRWSAKAERAFLAELTASANVSAAARAAGFSTTAAYNRRKLWPAFAAEWDAALREGYARIETLLIHAATNALDPEPFSVAPDAPTMTVAEAMNLLKLHRAGVHGGKPQRYGWRQQEPDIEEVRAEILRKVAAMERVRGGG